MNHSSQPPRVVVIDDSRSIRVHVVTLLRDAGYNAEGASDGGAGISLVYGHEPDVILLDVEMPGMSGLEVLDVLAGKQHLYSIIMCTTHSEMEQIVDALNRGADDYIVKPFNEQELLARVSAAERTVSLKKSQAAACRRADESLATLRETQAWLIEEKKLQAISRLAAGVAHEINNPLGYIRSNLNMLGRYADYLLNGINVYQKMAERCSNESDAPVNQLEKGQVVDARKLEKIRREFSPLMQETQQGVDRIAGIVTCFRNLEQGITGKREVREEDLSSIMRGLLNILSPTMPQGVLLVHKFDTAPLPLLGTLSMLNMAFEKLIQNAVDAVGSNGKITVNTWRDAGTIICDICDSGPGISEEVLPVVFDPFFTTKNDGHHFGLGLTIAECFIAAHGGTIGIESSAERGTCLRVSLPLAG